MFEPEVRKYFIRIVNTISIALLWMITSSAWGIYFGKAFWGNSFKLSNAIFYLFCITSFVLMIRYFIKLWKEPIFNSD